MNALDWLVLAFYVLGFISIACNIARGLDAEP